MIKRISKLTFLNATEERIPAIANRADANWIMIDYSAVRIHAARAWAWILTPLIDTCRVRATVCTDYAFRPARRWAADVIRLTGAHCVIINNATVAIWSTGRWLARIAWY